MNILRGRAQIFAVVIPVLVALALAGYLIFLKYQETKRLTNPQQASQEDVQKIIERVGKLIILPEGETPTVATVSDVTKLQDQPFFVRALNGDRVLIYQAAKKAILYRQSENRIVEVAPVNIGPVSEGTGSAQASAGSEPASIRFVLLNGTTTTGLTRQFETTLRERVPLAEVVTRDNAASSAYTASVLVDIAGTKRAQADTLARALGISVAGLPDGETKPENADFLIILGSDTDESTTSAIQ